jgi:SAM-dependent methyltransferase
MDKRLCNLCQQDRFEVVDVADNSYRVLQCLNCSLVFVDPLPDPCFLADHYDASYYADWSTRQLRQRMAMWRKRLLRLNRHQRPGRLLDVGCAEGTFLQLARDSGWDVQGTELSPYAADKAARVLGIPVFDGDLCDAGFEDESFDAVTLWHVLEHVMDPRGYLTEVRRVLKKTGLLVIAVPNVNNTIMRTAYRIFKHRPLKLFSIHDRELHLYHFSPQTLKDYLARTGYRCLNVSPDDGVIDPAKKIIHGISVILSRATGLMLCDAFEVHARTCLRLDGGTTCYETKEHAERPAS